MYSCTDDVERLFIAKRSVLYPE